MLGSGQLSTWQMMLRIAATFVVALGAILLAGSDARAHFGSPGTISGDGVEASSPRIATDSQNNALAVWTEREGDVERIRAAFRPDGGDVETIGFLSAPGELAYRPVVSASSWNITGMPSRVFSITHFWTALTNSACSRGLRTRGPLGPFAISLGRET